MTNRRHHKMTKSNLGHRPFVCHIYPNISSETSNVNPLVWKETPIVGKYRTESGFTLVEVMITILVAAILFGIAIPDFRTFIQNSRITTQSNDLIGALASTRSEAIKRNKSVVVCRSANPSLATPSCANDNANTWETGWLIFQDTDGDHLYTAADSLLSIHEPLAGNNTLRGNSTQLYNYVSYTPAGFTTLASPATGAPSNHFKVCDQRGATKARAVVIDPTGHARTETSSTFTSLACP